MKDELISDQVFSIINKELQDEICYIVVVLLNQFFYPSDLSTTTKNAINNNEQYAFDRFHNDSLFHARVKKITSLITDKTISLLAPELEKARKWDKVKETHEFKFVRHIEAHLTGDEVPVCKICGKTIFEIALEGGKR